jgi:hypothetical protein
MKRRVFGIALVLACLVLRSGSALAVVGFRGSTWGDLRGEMPKEGDGNLLLNGWIKQGVDWTKWGNVTLNTYATLRYQADTEGLDWNNSVGPGFGISLEAYSPRGIVAALGVEYIWDRYLGLDEPAQFDETVQKFVVYVNWYGWWDLKK